MKNKTQTGFFCKKVKLASLVRGNLKAPFSIAATVRCCKGATPRDLEDKVPYSDIVVSEFDFQ